MRLKDGTLMRGRILSKDSSAYVIETKALGQVRVNTADVLMVEDTAGGRALSQKDDYQKKILGNPGTMAAVEEISRDQEVIDMFSDPALKDAIMRQDMEYLKKDGRFIKFMQHPSVQKVVQDVSGKAQEDLEK